MKIRLDKFLSSQTPYSRSEIKALLKQKRIAVDGDTQVKADDKVDAEKDVITLDGRRIIYQEHVCYMMNKPKGVVCATYDREEKTVLDLLPESFMRSGLFPAGRLDKDTTGLVIITDDGALAHRMLSPKKHVLKYYRAVLDRIPDESIKEAFIRGIMLSDGTAFLPGEILSTAQNTVTLRIREGKYHQVKRMFKALSYTVDELQRYRIGALTLDPSLKAGEVRKLSEEEIERLLQD